MPKMPPIDIWTKADADKEITFHKAFPCMVSADDGRFYASLEPEEEAEMREIASQLFSDGSARFDFHRGRHYVSAASYEDLKRALYNYGRHKVEFTEVRERVIIYSLDISLHYVKHAPTGDIFPNGRMAPNYGTESNWNKDTLGHSATGTDRKVYSLGIGARVYDRVTRTTAAGVTTTRHERPTAPLQPAAAALNEFVHLHLIDSSFDRERLMGTSVPYSDELAEYLHGAILQLCKLADGLQSLFATPEALMLAAAQGAKLLSAPSSA
jgi:hypothetical protein